MRTIIRLCTLAVRPKLFTRQARFKIGSTLVVLGLFFLGEVRAGITDQVAIFNSVPTESETDTFLKKYFDGMKKCVETIDYYKLALLYQHTRDSAAQILSKINDERTLFIKERGTIGTSKKSRVVTELQKKYTEEAEKAVIAARHFLTKKKAALGVFYPESIFEGVFSIFKEHLYHKQKLAKNVGAYFSSEKSAEILQILIDECIIIQTECYWNYPLQTSPADLPQADPPEQDAKQAS